jgi:hypothetical protein
MDYLPFGEQSSFEHAYCRRFLFEGYFLRFANAPFRTECLGRQHNSHLSEATSYVRFARWIRSRLVQAESFRWEVKTS